MPSRASERPISLSLERSIDEERETVRNWKLCRFDPPRRIRNLETGWSEGGQQGRRGRFEALSLCDYFARVTGQGGRQGRKTTTRGSVWRRRFPAPVAVTVGKLLARSASTARNEVSRYKCIPVARTNIRYMAAVTAPVSQGNPLPLSLSLSPSPRVKEAADNIGPGRAPLLLDHAPFRIVGIISCIYCAVSTWIVQSVQLGHSWISSIVYIYIYIFGKRLNNPGSVSRGFEIPPVCSKLCRWIRDPAIIPALSNDAIFVQFSQRMGREEEGRRGWCR